MKIDRRAYMRDYRQNYGVKMIEQAKEWFKHHPRYLAEYCKRWRQLHPDYARKKCKIWRQEHPNYYKIKACKALDYYQQ